MKKIILFVTLLTLILVTTACSSGHKHTYDDGEVTKEVTCTESGTILYSCTECPFVYTKTVESGHVWKAGDCTSPKTCERCGCEDGEAPGHVYENNVCTTCKNKLNVELELPEASEDAPVIIHNKKGNDIQSTYKITNISYTFSGTTDDNVTVTIVLEGEKTDDALYGTSRNVAGKIAYKIYDSEGFVIFSSTKDTMMLKEGDKFKNLKISLSGFNAEQKYTFEFFDYYS